MEHKMPAWTWWHTAIVSAICVGITLLIYFTLDAVFVVFLFIPPLIALKQIGNCKRQKRCGEADTCAEKENE
ncbi:MAG: hypothetical protein CVT48_02455 [Thermoplasmata archaeon HGW-Thermoplasmata-1]|nr:MAG: hypothetical protein CVT48_02455 [Thermoplasmata archaeon HGW-Thermoplasmata-1]